MRVVTLAVALLVPAGASAEMVTTRYLCERGVEVPAVYVNDADPNVAVIGVEGRMIALEQERSGSGVRYGWPSDGSHYVWWTKGREATLYWSDGATGEQEVLLAECSEE